MAGWTECEIAMYIITLFTISTVSALTSTFIWKGPIFLCILLTIIHAITISFSCKFGEKIAIRNCEQQTPLLSDPSSLPEDEIKKRFSFMTVEERLLVGEQKEDFRHHEELVRLHITAMLVWEKACLDSARDSTAAWKAVQSAADKVNRSSFSVHQKRRKLGQIQDSLFILGAIIEKDQAGVSGTAEQEEKLTKLKRKTKDLEDEIEKGSRKYRELVRKAEDARNVELNSGQGTEPFQQVTQAAKREAEAKRSQLARKCQMLKRIELDIFEVEKAATRRRIGQPAVRRALSIAATGAVELEQDIKSLEKKKAQLEAAKAKEAQNEGDLRRTAAAALAEYNLKFDRVHDFGDLWRATHSTATNVDECLARINKHNLDLAQLELDMWAMRVEIGTINARKKRENELGAFERNEELRKRLARRRRSCTVSMLRII